MKTTAIAVLLGILLLAGCSRPPTVQFENLALVSSLRTACSARNEAWLAGVERAVMARHAAGEMSEVEKVHFDKLISSAKHGDWQGAEKQCYQFEMAQLSRQRPAPADDAHPHSHPESPRVTAAYRGP